MVQLLKERSGRVGWRIQLRNNLVDSCFYTHGLALTDLGLPTVFKAAPKPMLERSMAIGSLVAVAVHRSSAAPSGALPWMPRTPGQGWLLLLQQLLQSKPSLQLCCSELGVLVNATHS